MTTSVHVNENGDVTITGINTITIKSTGELTVVPDVNQHPKRPIDPIKSGLLTPEKLTILQNNVNGFKSTVENWKNTNKFHGSVNFHESCLGKIEYSKQFSLSFNPGRQCGKSYFVLSEMEPGDIFIVLNGSTKRAYETEVRYPSTLGRIVTVNEILKGTSVDQNATIYVNDASYMAPEVIDRLHEIFRKPIVLLG